MSIKDSRIGKSIKNAKYNVVFLTINIFIAFFSRKIFIDSLGTQFIGLTSTLQSFLGFLNLAELGVATAIGVTLYKPLAQKDIKSVGEIMSVMGFLYRRIGIFILICGIILSIFLPLIFEKEQISLYLIYFAYFVFLGSSLINYFINYRQVLFGADQRSYENTKYLQSTNIIKLLIQMAIAHYTQNVYLWVAIEMLFSWLFCVILNIRIRKIYPWLKCNIKIGKEKIADYPIVSRYVKQLFIHKISALVSSQLSPLLIFAYVSLNMVTFYSNYMTVIGKLSLFVNAILGSTAASVGNFIADKTKDISDIISLYKEMLAIRFFIAGFFVFMIYLLIDPFVMLWLGKQYLLPNTILVFIIIDVFIQQYREATDQFIQAYGLFQDIWASLVETLLFITFSIIGGSFYGLLGILGAGILTKILIAGLWKPYFLFSQGFHISVFRYWRLFMLHVCIIVGTILLSLKIYNVLMIEFIDNWIQWISAALISASIYLFIIILAMFLFVPDFKRVTFKLIRYYKNCNIHF